MKVLLFLMDNRESLDMALPLLRTLAQARVEVTLVQNWSKDLFPVDDLIELKLNYLTLSDAGFDSIPRLSSRQYQALCGDDLDLLACQYHNLEMAGYPTDRQWLHRDALHHHRYRGLAYRAETLLRTCAPDVVIVQQGSESVSKIVYAKSTHLGLPTLLIDSSFVPGTILLDSQGMHFFPGQNRVERDWPRVRATPLNSEQADRLRTYLAGWNLNRISKYNQITSRSEEARFREFLASGRRLLFLVDQLPWDANVVNGLGVFESFPAMVTFVRNHLPDEWAAVYKLHPKNPLSATTPLGPVADRFFVARDLSIHRIFESCDAVFTFSSNVGLEALIAEKPVITCGAAHYGGRGLTLDLTRREDLPDLLDQAPTFRPDPELCARFLHYILFDYLIEPGDVEAVLRRFEEARSVARFPGDRWSPLSAHYPPRFHAYRALEERYNQFVQENLTHEEALARLAADCRQGSFGSSRSGSLSEPDGARLDSGERQVATALDGIAANHRIRYSFARRFVDDGHEVLDFACGAGYGTFMLAAETGARVTGVDSSAPAIQFARDCWSAERITYVHASAGSFPYREASYDVVVAFETVEHVPNDRRFVEQLWKTLRPGGLLMLSVPNLNEYPMLGHEFHVQHYSEAGVRRLLEGLPGLALSRVLGQVGETCIDSRASGKHLLALAQKAGAGGSLEAFRQRLDALLPFTELAVPQPTRPAVRVRADRFHTHVGEIRQGVLSVDLTRTDCHVVFGPYIRLPAGAYSVGLLMTIDGQVVEDGGEVALDICAGYGPVYLITHLHAGHLRTIATGRCLVTLPFQHTRPDDDLQFRIHVAGRPFRGRLMFHGIEVRDLTMPRNGSDMRNAVVPRPGAGGDVFAEPYEVLDLSRWAPQPAEALLAPGEPERSACRPA